MQTHFLAAYQQAVLAFLEQEKQSDDPKEPLDLFFHEVMKTSVEQSLALPYREEMRLLKSEEPGSTELYRLVFDIRAAAEKEYRAWFQLYGFDYEHILPSPTTDSTPTPLAFYIDPDGEEHSTALHIGQLVVTITKNWDKTRTYQVSEPKSSRWLVAGNRWSAKARDTSFKATVYNAVTHLDALTNWSLYSSSPKKVQRAIHLQALSILTGVSRTP